MKENSKRHVGNDFAQIGAYFTFLSLLAPAKYSFFIYDFDTLGYPIFFTVWYFLFGLVIVYQGTPRLEDVGNAIPRSYYLEKGLQYYFILPEFLGIIITIIILVGLYKIYITSKKLENNDIKSKHAAVHFLLWPLATIFLVLIWIIFHPIVIRSLHPLFLDLYGDSVNLIYRGKITFYFGVYFILLSSCITIIGSIITFLSKDE